MSLIERVAGFVEGEREVIVGLRRHFHRNPEASMEEVETAAKIEAVLQEAGISCRRVGKTGVAGVIPGGRGAGRVLALRADIDALRIQDEKDEPYRSAKPGLMHACGHDAHAAALLGAARALAAQRAAFTGEVRLFFQPGEETGYGDAEFFEAGLMKGVEKVFGAHMASDLPVGKVGLTAGPNNASADYFKIAVTGKSAHVSTPEKGVDALYAACQIVTALQGVVTRQNSPVNPVVVGVGVLRSGSAYNIVAESAVLEGTLRALLPPVRAALKAKIDSTARTAGSLSGAGVDVEWHELAKPLFNPPDVCEEAARIAAGLFGEANIVRNRPFSFAGDNFASFQAAAPGVYAYIGSSNPAKPNTCLAHHNCRFDIDEEAVVIAAKLYAGWAAALLSGAGAGAGA